MQLSTVKIQDGKDYIVINEADFDEKKHKKFLEAPAKDAAKKDD
ncbi:hypothetical protein [Sulfitobacter pacificus]